VTEIAAAPMTVHGQPVGRDALGQPLSMAVRRAGILYQVKRPQVIALAKEVESFFHRQGVEVVSGAITTEDSMICQKLDLFVTIGGDGTMLRAARCAAQWQTPLLGINMGRLGFLTECGPENWEPTLTKVLAQQWWRESRCMLSVAIDGVKQPMFALNDVVLARGAHPRALHVDLAIDGVRIGEVVTDAMIVATPTGSTAYAMAAGGPVLDPRLDAFTLVPVAAHLSMPGPMVLPGTSVVSLTSTRNVDAVLALDGQVDLPVGTGQTVTVRAGEHACLFARTQPADRFYATMVTRLRRK